MFISRERFSLRKEAVHLEVRATCQMHIYVPAGLFVFVFFLQKSHRNSKSDLQAFAALISSRLSKQGKGQSCVSTEQFRRTWRKLRFVTMASTVGLQSCVKSTEQLSWGTLKLKIMSDDTSWMASSQRLSIICLLILAPLSFILPSSHCSSILVILSSFLLQHACVCLCAFVFREREKHLDIEGSQPTGELQRAKHRCSLQSVSWTLASNRKALCLRTPPQPILWCNRSLSHTYSLLQPVVHPSLNWNWSQLHSSSSTMSYSCTSQNWRQK